LSVALRELGRIERTLYALDWMQNVELAVPSFSVQ
jgi:TnpA family transposase